MTDINQSHPIEITDDIICGLANHFSSLRFRRLQGGALSPQEEEGVEAYEKLLRLIYPPPPGIPKEIMDIAHDILERAREEKEEKAFWKKVKEKQAREDE
jgi:hypothetical protein